MRKYLLLTVFISGLTCLALEMTASRLLERTFGMSNLVWASIIGLIMIYLAAGYFLGGYWADRSPNFRTFFQILIWAALAIALIPLISRPVLQAAADAFDKLQIGILAGAFIAVLILLAVPVVLLGTASPFAIRLAVHRNQTVGQVSGRIYSISTLGSFIGTFLPVLILIPGIGTYRTFLVLSAILLVMALIGLWRTCGGRAVLVYLWTPLVLILIWMAGLSGPDRATSGMIFETESGYNYLQVVENNQYRILRMNDGQGMHSVYHPTILNYYGPWEMVLIAPYFNPVPYAPDQVKRIAIVGLAAGTTARQATAVYGPIPIDGYEIDEKVVEIGRRYFDMNQPNLNVFIQDGRWGLEHSPNRYQIISVDAYRPPYIPWHLTTQEFFQSVRQHLSDDGVMVINVGRAPNDRRLIEALTSTILSVFPSVHVVDVPRTFNSILYATVQNTSPDNLQKNLAYLQSLGDAANPLLLETVKTSAASLQPAPAPGLVFTDDRAPVEWITNDMILRFILSGEKLQ
jgi:spermidine synthase